MAESDKENKGKEQKEKKKKEKANKEKENKEKENKGKENKEDENKPNRGIQYYGACAACLGGFCLGGTIGWSSSAYLILDKKGEYTSMQLSWTMSLMPLGAALSGPCVIFIARRFGVKNTMVYIGIPYTIGWGLMFCPYLATLLVGRFMQGFCGGAFCYCAPAFVGEISDPQIRGRLCVLFQLNIVLGIMLAYCLGIPEDYLILTIPLTLLPFITSVMIFFLANSPVFYLSKKKDEEAIKALQFYRGKKYVIDQELEEMRAYVKASEVSEGSNPWKEIRTKPVTKGFLLALLMQIVQQLSGINSLMFYAHPIFEKAHAAMETWTAPVILGATQIVATGISFLVIERAGRKLLMLVSLSIMTLCFIILGVFFYLDEFYAEEAEKITVIPITSACIYMVGFSLGTGPIPYILIGEMLAESVKNILGPVCVFTNWILAFIVTVTFNEVVEVIGGYSAFWIFSGCCLTGAIIIGIFLFETKGLTLVEIQRKLGAK